MLRIHGNDFGAVLFRFRHDELSGADQGLLIGKADPLSGPDGSQGGLQPHHAHHSGYDAVRASEGGGFHQPRLAVRYPDGKILNPVCQGLGSIPSRHYGKLRQESPALLLHTLHALPGSQRPHPDPGQVGNNIQRLPANGAGGPQDTNTFYHGFPLIIPPWAAKESAPPSAEQQL